MPQENGAEQALTMAINSNLITCPISGLPIKRVVFASDGHFYDLEALNQRLLENNNCSPITGKPLRFVTVVYPLQNTIETATPDLERPNEEHKKALEKTLYQMNARLHPNNKFSLSKLIMLASTSLGLAMYQFPEDRIALVFRVQVITTFIVKALFALINGTFYLNNAIAQAMQARPQPLQSLVSFQPKPEHRPMVKVDQDLVFDSYARMVFRHPVIASDGLVYELAALNEWLKKRKTEGQTKIGKAGKVLTYVEYAEDLKNTLDEHYGDDEERHPDYAMVSELTQVKLNVGQMIDVVKLGQVMEQKEARLPMNPVIRAALNGVKYVRKIEDYFPLLSLLTFGFSICVMGYEAGGVEFIDDDMSAKSGGNVAAMMASLIVIKGMLMTLETALDTANIAVQKAPQLVANINRFFRQADQQPRNDVQLEPGQGLNNNVG